MSFTSRFNRKGALSAVTGGHPEDINQMPPNTDPTTDLPIYDGSDLKSKHNYFNKVTLTSVAFVALGIFLLLRKTVAQGT